MKNTSTLPGWPLMLRRELAAAYLSLSPSTFDTEVKACRIPQPVAITPGIYAWHRGILDAWAEDRQASAATATPANPWDDVR